MEFSGRYGPWAIITGASEGTGAAFAHRLAKNGINLIVIARRQEPLATLVKTVLDTGVECVGVSVDLACDDAAAQVIEAAGDREVGLLITNAGADMNGSSFLDSDIANWERLVQLNILTSIRLVHYFGRRMRDRRRGGIILVGSGACYGGLNGISVYSASKGFLLNFGEGLWAELRNYGVDILNLILNRTDTPAHRRLMERNGQSIPSNMAKSEDVAEIGLARLSQGPDYNWGQEDNMAGFAPNSPAERRARILKIEEMCRAYTGPRKSIDSSPAVEL